MGLGICKDCIYHGVKPDKPNKGFHICFNSEISRKRLLYPGASACINFKKGELGICKKCKYLKVDKYGSYICIGKSGSKPNIVLMDGPIECKHYKYSGKHFPAGELPKSTITVKSTIRDKPIDFGDDDKLVDSSIHSDNVSFNIDEQIYKKRMKELALELEGKFDKAREKISKCSSCFHWYIQNVEGNKCSSCSGYLNYDYINEQQIKQLEFILSSKPPIIDSFTGYSDLLEEQLRKRLKMVIDEKEKVGIYGRTKGGKKATIIIDEKEKTELPYTIPIIDLKSLYPSVMITHSEKELKELGKKHFEAKSCKGCMHLKKEKVGRFNWCNKLMTKFRNLNKAKSCGEYNGINIDRCGICTFFNSKFRHKWGGQWEHKCLIGVNVKYVKPNDIIPTCKKFRLHKKYKR